jgi:hypothetical protein
MNQTGFNDEKLSGIREGQRSSRLNLPVALAARFERAWRATATE